MLFKESLWTMDKAQRTKNNHKSSPLSTMSFGELKMRTDYGKILDQDQDQISKRFSDFI